MIENQSLILHSTMKVDLEAVTYFLTKNNKFEHCVVCDTLSTISFFRQKHLYRNLCKNQPQGSFFLHIYNGCVLHPKTLSAKILMLIFRNNESYRRIYLKDF